MKLDDLAPLLGIIAAERTAGRPDLYDEVRQEALIAAWRVSTARPDASRQYVVAAARRAANDVLRGRPGFGEEGRRGWQDAADYADPLTYSDEDDEDAVLALADPTAAEALERVERTAHDADVWRAVKALPGGDRALVEERFVNGLGWPAVAKALGRKPEAARRRFVEHAAPRLREDLAHLREVAP